jgi:2'-5' RNA ligase
MKGFGVSGQLDQRTFLSEVAAVASVRLFIAARLPADVAASLETLERAWPYARWSHGDQLHVTLRFLGDTDETLVAPLTARLSSLHLSAFEARIAGVGTFPNARPARRDLPRVLWMGLEPPARWTDLKQAVDGVLGPEPGSTHRAFTPHVTLARLAARIPPVAAVELRRELASFLRTHAAFASPSWPVTRFDLVQSTLRPAGAEHRMLVSFPLAEPV